MIAWLSLLTHVGLEISFCGSSYFLQKHKHFLGPLETMQVCPFLYWH